MIGDDIEVVVVDIRGDKVRLGITAPKKISVHRKEVYDQIQRENKAASTMQADDLPTGTPSDDPEARGAPAGGANRQPSKPSSR